MTHAVSGVEKGILAGGQPVEIMGLMLGHVCVETKETLIVTDVFPLPIEGAETRVLADDQEVLNYMIDLGESLEQTRQERFMGWYHSHPFDVELNSHCFMSSTDISTQLGWQRAEDRNGNPWLGIVIDPLRSLAKGRPELGAFRAYPPEYNGEPNQTPDGKIELDDKVRVERWGSCWNRYHTLQVKYFMSSLSARILNLVSKNFLWMNPITSTPGLEMESKERFAERVNDMSSKMTSNSGMCSSTASIPFGGSLSKTTQLELVDKVSKIGSELSLEQLQTQLSQISKHIMFQSSSY